MSKTSLFKQYEKTFRLSLSSVPEFLVEKPSLAFANVLAGEKRQPAKMALLGAEYISYAGKLPPEFGSIATKILLDLQQLPSHTTVLGARP